MMAATTASHMSSCNCCGGTGQRLVSYSTTGVRLERPKPPTPKERKHKIARDFRDCLDKLLGAFWPEPSVREHKIQLSRTRSRWQGTRCSLTWRTV